MYPITSGVAVLNDSYKNSMTQNDIEAFVLMTTEKSILSKIKYQTVIYLVAQKSKSALYKL